MNRLRRPGVCPHDLEDPAGGVGPWEGRAVLALWTAAALLAGWRAGRRRDA
ncbi:hypothetical protein [Streptomyces sp. NPDC048636]|uniref:hypothetical protein n=1 Tax=Streptomyces sp. NPDC048636 TaxID=3155762 RepID=UPI00343989BA